MLSVEAACLHEIPCDSKEEVLPQAPVWKLLKSPTKFPVLYAEEPFHFCMCHIQYLGIFFMEITLNEELFYLPLLLPIWYCN